MTVNFILTRSLPCPFSPARMYGLCLIRTDVSAVMEYVLRAVAPHGQDPQRGAPQTFTPISHTLLPPPIALPAPQRSRCEGTVFREVDVQVDPWAVMATVMAMPSDRERAVIRFDRGIHSAVFVPQPNANE